MMRNLVFGVALITFAGVAPAQDESPLKDKEIGEKLAAVDHEVARLREADARAQPSAKAYADDLARRARRVRDEMAGKLDAADATGGPELHVVGVYEGSFPDGPRKYGMAAVRVENTGRPIILAICSYEPVRWRIDVAEGTKLRRIIVSGRGDQLLEQPPAGVDIERHDSKDNPGNRFYAYRRNGEGSESYARTESALKRLTGLPICTFVGRYRYDGKPLLIGRGNPDWLGQYVMSRLEPLYLEATAVERAKHRHAMAAARFPAIWWTSTGDGPFQVQGNLAEFTLAGPIESTLRPLPDRVNRVAIDPRGPSYYGIVGHYGFAKVDLNARTATDVKIEEDIPELSWPDGVAFDTKRNRVVVTTHGGVGYMYTYDPAQRTWALLRDMGNVDLQSLTYSQEHDCFYGLSRAFGGARPITLITFNSNGATTESVRLDIPLPSASDRMSSFTPPQLAAVGDHVAILVAPGARGDARDAPPPMRCLLIDPKTGKQVYSGKLSATIAPEAAVDGDALPRLWKSLTEAEAEIAARTLEAKLAGSGDAAARHIRANLPRLDPPDPAKVRDLLARLDQDRWKDREEATAQLLRFAGSIEPQLRAAHAAAASEEVRSRITAVLQKLQSLRESDPTRDADDTDGAVTDPTLRTRLRAVRILYRIATPAAVEALRDIAAGPAGAIDAEQAKLALQKL